MSPCTSTCWRPCERARAARPETVVLGARYGLASKELTPAMVKGVFDELSRPSRGRHLTVGINDDVTHLSVSPDPDFSVPTSAVQAVFFGLGADGTVGANKSSIRIIGDGTDSYVQGYFVIDSQKAGSVTVSHLRFGPEPIRSTYLVDQADFVACHQFGLLEKMKVLELARPGATFLLELSVRGRRGVGAPPRRGAGAVDREGHRVLRGRRPLPGTRASGWVAA